MTGRREYEIAFVGLKPGVHQFEYRIDDKFFTAFQQQDFKNCQADVKLTRELVEAGRHMKVTVHDHVIVGTHGQSSLRAMGLM